MKLSEIYRKAARYIDELNSVGVGEFACHAINKVQGVPIHYKNEAVEKFEWLNKGKPDTEAWIAPDVPWHDPESQHQRKLYLEFAAEFFESEGM